MIVVDNDAERSAESEVRQAQAVSPVPIEYYVEPEKNIALARNLTLDRAAGNLIAFIDDDEIPIERWLLELYLALVEFDAEGVLGALLPKFDEAPPSWLTRHKLYYWENERLVSGVVQTRCNAGNALFKRSILDKGVRFDPVFGHTGGEDSDFFDRLAAQGCRFVSSSKGLVYELIPPERTRPAYLLKRKVLHGCTAMRRFRLQGRSRRFLAVWMAKALFGIGFCGLSSLAAAVVPGASALKHAMKAAYFLGFAAEFAGIAIVDTRSSF